MSALTPSQERAVRKIVAEVLAETDLAKSGLTINAFARFSGTDRPDQAMPKITEADVSRGIAEFEAGYAHGAAARTEREEILDRLFEASLGTKLDNFRQAVATEEAITQTKTEAAEQACRDTRVSRLLRCLLRLRKGF